MNNVLISLSAILAALPSTPKTKPQYEPIAQITTQMYSPLTGLWRLELETEKNCTEDYNFGANNKLLVVSDTEWTYGKYRLFEAKINGKKSKMPLLVLQTTFDNNNPDCSGVQKDQTGEQFAAYFKWLDKNSFELCDSDAGKNCMMRFNRVLP